MWLYALKRVFVAVPTLWVVVTIVFFIMRLAPGGPFDLEVALSPDVKENLEAAYGLDRPMIEQYLRYLSGLLQGDLGPSFKNVDYDVSALIAEGAPVSFKLGACALVTAMIVGITGGSIAAMKQNSLMDLSIMLVLAIGIVVPSFVIAPLLTLVFGVHLGILPVGGWGEGRLLHLILPTISLALPVAAYLSRLTRASMIDVLHSNFIRTARAKGLPLRRIVLRHALKPTLIPVISYLAPAAAAIVTGSVVVETIFGLPGIGRYFVQGSINRDYTLVLGIVIFYTAIVILFNLVVEMIYATLNPRIRYD